MKRYGKQIALVALIGGLLYLLYVGHEREKLERAGVGRPAVAFSLPVLGTDRSTGPQDYLGKVVLIDFWATFCRPCRQTMPVMQSLHERYDEDEFCLLSVNVDPDRGDLSRPALVRQFMRRLGVSFPVLLDDGPVSVAYGVNTIPYVVLIDRQGVVRWAHDGPTSEEGLRERIDELLAESS